MTRFFTTLIPISFMESYEFECNREEVNVIVSKNLMSRNSKSNCVSIQGTDGLKNNTIEVKFDLVFPEKKVKEPIEESAVIDPFGKFIGNTFILKGLCDYQMEDVEYFKGIESVTIASKATRTLLSKEEREIVVRSGINPHIGMSKPNCYSAIGLPNNTYDFELSTKPFMKVLKFLGGDDLKIEIVKPELLNGKTIYRFILRNDFYTSLVYLKM